MAVKQANRLLTVEDYVVVQPDLLFISQTRRPELIQDRIKGAPDLIVEILSPTSSDRDVNQNRKLYARYGVPEYWIIDPDDSTVEVQRRQGTFFLLSACMKPGRRCLRRPFQGWN